MDLLCIQLNVLVPAVICIHQSKLPRIYTYFIYTETARTIERFFVHMLVRLDRSQPSLRFLRRFSFFITPSNAINTSIQRIRLQY